ncbi:MAG: DNA internalization-related competence protein ComEC/Rec2, partial [Clostridium sp.]|nr:DNA internalization-related competence protein ComEC/Rec2 [Clostridium sp.]
MTKRPLATICLIITLLLFLSVQISPPPDDNYEEFQGQAVTVTGRVYKKETAQQAGETVTTLYLKMAGHYRTDEMQADTGPPAKNIMCYLSAGQREPELGSTVRLSGKLSVFEKASNPGQFDARSYYQILGISYRLNQTTILAKTIKYNRFTETLHVFRKFLSAKLSEGLPEREASVMQAMLLGEKSSMEKDLKLLYQRNGIAHILAISGLHISLIGMGLYKLLRKIGVPMKAAAVSAVGVLLLYGLMTGFSVSAVRAIFMFSMRMLGIFLERTSDMLTSAGLAAVLILLQQPLYLQHSGFLFSFGCVVGIGLILPPLTEGKKELPAIAKGFLSGAGMAVVTLPVYLWFYYQFPVYSIFLNFLVIPLMSLLMAAGLLFLACQFLFPPAGVFFAFFIRGVLTVYEKACGICECLPGNLFTPGKPEGWQTGVCLLLLAFLAVMKKRVNLAARWGIAAFAALVLTVHPAEGLKITFLDVGQGDCIYIENENKSRYLIDGGSSTVGKVGEYRLIPFLKSQGASRLDGVFVTHPDEDHCNGIRELLSEGELQGIWVRRLILPDISEESRNESYKELMRTAEEAGIPVSYASKGQIIKKGGLTMECLHPLAGSNFGEANEYSLVFRLTYGGFRALLTGDVEGSGEKQLIRLLQEENREKQLTRLLQEEENGGNLTVLKTSHHGSRNSTPEEFLDSQKPIYTVISCGKKNFYGHPHAELL